MQSLPEQEPTTKGPVFSEDKVPIVADSEQFIRQAFAQDSRKGYELLYRRYYKVLCSHAVRYVYGREVAEDLVSEVFLSLWRNQSFMTITSSYRAYLFSAVRKRAYSHVQEEFGRRGISLEQPEETLPTQDDPQHILQYTELLNQLENGIRSLPPQCQRVFLLSRFEGKKHREIADELNINQKTVEAHLHKALEHLRRITQNGFLFLLLWIS
ncbi:MULTISPECIES: RNA polymerase sigma-70 factor [unclassified Siphonobacter]|uniref:RNA polymerase sigma-70 factor n=1 Tax=unclassified Siphonobacter TaxID=2635712 RepID=UPI00278A60BD|nr:MULTISPECIES: RNA polymerase sigma-70 factor [unclassified Siphonobacter]MDQ1085469.1 RNA polymerase sigma-70 factor (family 1) [Siphonobacter sp. SORGH_AS_1065]MDR6197324.1 RNA polymerase sigma-70 factor (family 1) [Siphonobacter sp. SORGH_AS_0500]